MFLQKILSAGLNETTGKYENVKPILTPRFTPSCSDELMTRLAEIQRTYRLPVQSHLSENQGEIAWVKELCLKELLSMEKPTISSDYLAVNNLPNDHGSLRLQF